MIVGTSFFKMDGNDYYSPEFGRGGLAAVFTVDVTQIVGGPTVTITIEHRNSDEQAFGDLGTFAAVTTTGVASVDQTGCKEILRFKYAFDAGDDATDGIHMLMMAPTWRPY